MEAQSSTPAELSRRSAIILDLYRSGPVNTKLATELATNLILASSIETNPFARTHPKGPPRGFVEIIAGPSRWSVDARSAHEAVMLARLFLATRQTYGLDRTRATANLYTLEAAVIDASLHALIEERCA